MESATQARGLDRLALSALALCLFAFCLVLIFPPATDSSARLLFEQDRWLLLAQAILLVAARYRLTSGVLPLARRLSEHDSILAVLALSVVAFCYGGHHWILSGYDLSRDEKLAVFDSRIYASGILAQPLAPVWQAHAEALNTTFMLPISRPIAWVSAYLPMNAALRAVVGLIADPALTGPLMTALAVICLWKCARLLWPEDREAAVVALILLLGSGQVLFAGMTAYAMPAHLTLDLLWLWFFLVGRRSFDTGALIVGFVATGLHQPLFHPLFAAPILWLLVLDRNWPRATFYGLGYAVICAFWLWWPHAMHALVTGPDSLTAAGGTDYGSRLLQTMREGRATRWSDMAANLLRFVAWQAVLLVPLMAAGFAVARRDRMAMALAVSAVLPIAVMLLIMPYQGYGFGYRYLHGVIGCAILVAVFGWRSLVIEQHPALRALFVRTMMTGLFVLLPLQAWLAHRFYEPFADADRKIAASGADYFIIGQDDAPSANDLVLNRPDVSNRPIRLVAEYVDDDLADHICRPGASVAMPTGTFLRREGRFFGDVPTARPEARLTALADRLRARGCRIEWLG